MLQYTIDPHGDLPRQIGRILEIAIEKPTLDTLAESITKSNHGGIFIWMKRTDPETLLLEVYVP